MLSDLLYILGILFIILSTMYICIKAMVKVAGIQFVPKQLLVASFFLVIGVVLLVVENAMNKEKNNSNSKEKRERKLERERENE